MVLGWNVLYEPDLMSNFIGLKIIYCSGYPAVAANGLLAFLAGVGVQTFIALHAVRVLLAKYVLLPKQGLLTVVTVVALRHLRFDL